MRGIKRFICELQRSGLRRRIEKLRREDAEHENLERQIRETRQRTDATISALEKQLMSLSSQLNTGKNVRPITGAQRL